MYWRRQWQPTPVFLPGESQGRGAWWAAVYGVTQSRTLLKRLSSSSSGHIPIQHWNWVWNISLRFFEYNPVQFLLKRIKRSIICNQLSRWYCVISKTVENSSDIYYRNKQPHIPKSQVLFTVTIFNNSLSCIWWPPPPPFFWQQFRGWSSTAVIWWNSDSKVRVFILTAITVSSALILYCCPNKLPQTWRLKNINLLSYSSVSQKSIMGLTRLQSKYQPGRIPFRNSAGEHVLPSPVPGGCPYRGPFFHLHSRQYWISLTSCWHVPLTGSLLLRTLMSKLDSPR